MMPGRPWVRAEDLTPRDIAVLDQNWRACNTALDDLLAQIREHHDQCCATWYCGSQEMTEQLDGYNLADVQMMLRAAMERLLA